MENRYDAIVVGGGHNGLACAAYLARAGLSVVVLERRHIAGGLCGEFEFIPGYKAAMPNSPGSLEPKIVQELELKRFGLEFNRPDPSVVMPFPDGRCLMVWRDPVRVQDEIRKFSKKDATGYYELFEFLNQFAGKLGVSLFESPPSLRELVARLKTPEDEEAFAKIVFGSLKELLDEYLEFDGLKAMIAAISMTSNLVGPWTPGSPYLLMMRPISLASSNLGAEHDPRRQYLRGSTGLPIGGMGSVTRAMQHSLEAAGGKVRTESAVEQILVGKDGVEGVGLASGEEVYASIVTSNVHPRTTLLDMVEANRLDSGYRERLSKRPRRGSAFKLGARAR